MATANLYTNVFEEKMEELMISNASVGGNIGSDEDEVPWNAGNSAEWD